MTPQELTEKYQAIMELEELGAWYLAKILRERLKLEIETYWSIL